MKTTEVNHEIIGKRCKCMFTGMMVTGTIEEIKRGNYTVSVKVRFDEPHQWGEDLWESDWSHARLSDEFGSLHHLEIIDDGYRAVIVKFCKSIKRISLDYAQDNPTWGAVNLKEWIDSYEGSRFTQIDSHTAVITSDNNMDHLWEWLRRNTEIHSYQFIIA